MKIIISNNEVSAYGVLFNNIFDAFEIKVDTKFTAEALHAVLKEKGGKLKEDDTTIISMQDGFFIEVSEESIIETIVVANKVIPIWKNVIKVVLPIIKTVKELLPIIKTVKELMPVFEKAVEETALLYKEEKEARYNSRVNK